MEKSAVKLLAYSFCADVDAREGSELCSYIESTEHC